MTVTRYVRMARTQAHVALRYARAGMIREARQHWSDARWFLETARQLRDMQEAA